MCIVWLCYRYNSSEYWRQIVELTVHKNFSNLIPPFSTCFTRRVTVRNITYTEWYKSYGLYSSPIRLLKCSSVVIAPVLIEMLNTSIRLGTYPSKVKIVKTTPVFKSDDDTDANNNYRPISLLSNFNRVFEKIIYNRLTSCIKKHELLYSSQYSFRKGHSTQHAILDIVNDIRTNMNQRLLSCGQFISIQFKPSTPSITIFCLIGSITMAFVK